MDPCRQEGNIGALHATVEAIKDTLDKLSDGQVRFIDTLEKIAAQGEKINKLSTDTNELFGRVRSVELIQESEKTKTMMLVAGVATIVTAGINWLTGK